MIGGKVCVWFLCGVDVGCFIFEGDLWYIILVLFSLLFYVFDIIYLIIFDEFVIIFVIYKIIMFFFLIFKLFGV